MIQKNKTQIFILFLTLSVALFSCAKKEQKANNTANSIVAADDNEYRHWVWLYPDAKDTDEELHKRYKKYRDAGIAGIFFGSDSERHYRIAKQEGLQAHRWQWIMNRGDALEKHPEWSAISRSGKATADNPPYVNYYRWMCPTNPEVENFLVEDVKNILSKDYVDGIHFDYIRYSDVILAPDLWKNYGIIQTEELPEYDFCYCDLCKEEFKKKYGKDIDKIEFPQASLSWKDFRYGQVNHIADTLIQVAAQYGKPATAAVFPTPDVAKKLVMQDWTNWNLSAVFPMIYQGFYKEDIPWIGSAVQQDLKGINGRYPIYAGLYMPDFENTDEIRKGVETALSNGADGVAIFGDLNDDILQILKDNKVKGNKAKKNINFSH